MEPKKNPKADINQFKGLFFATGLALILGLVWFSLELRTYDKSDYKDRVYHPEKFIEEEIPITVHHKEPPPPKAVAPDEILVEENDKEVPETPLETTESDQDDVILKIDEIKVEEDPDDDAPVDFIAIEQAPLFPKCINKTKSKQKECFIEAMQKHIRKHFRYPEAALELGIQGPVYTMFTIDKNGKVTNIRLKGTNALLEKEALRIIEKLPQFIPGKQRGQPVKTTFSQPITFKIN